MRERRRQTRYIGDWSSDVCSSDLMDRADLRADRADRRMDQFDKKLDVTRRLVQQGMKIVIDLGKTQKELSKSQKELDFKLNALIDRQRSEERPCRERV